MLTISQLGSTKRNLLLLHRLGNQDRDSSLTRPALTTSTSHRRTRPPHPYSAAKPVRSPSEVPPSTTFSILFRTAAPFNGSVKSLGSICEHVITVTTSLKKKPTLNTPQRSVRYFASIKKDGLITLGEYREINWILYTFLLDTSSFEETTNKARFASAIHHQTYQLLRQDRSADNSTGSEEFSYLRTPAPTQPITEGEGESRPVLSRKDLSYEKRKFMVKWLRYGRQDQFDERVESIKAEERDRDKRTSWDWECEEQLEEERKLEQQREEEAKSEQVKLEERMDFEIRHCLGKMRMLFLMVKKYVGA